jgi:ribokinase
MELAAEQRRPLMLNLAPARALSEAGLRRLTYLVVNESEAEFLCGAPVGSLEQAAAAARELQARGPHVVLLTLGSQGVYAADRDSCTHVPAFAVEGVDATAAGDVFCGALAVSLVEQQNRPLSESVRFASAAAAISVTRLGAQPSIPARHEIEQFLQAHSSWR